MMTTTPDCTCSLATHIILSMMIVWWYINVRLRVCPCIYTIQIQIYSPTISTQNLSFSADWPNLHNADAARRHWWQWGSFERNRCAHQDAGNKRSGDDLASFQPRTFVNWMADNKLPHGCRRLYREFWAKYTTAGRQLVPKCKQQRRVSLSLYSPRTMSAATRTTRMAKNERDVPPGLADDR